MSADHVTVWRWVQRYAPELDRRLRSHLKPTNKSWRVDETYIRVKDKWTYCKRLTNPGGNQRRAADQLAGVRLATCSAFGGPVPATRRRDILLPVRQPTARFHHRENRRDFRARLHASHVQPVLAAECYRAHRVLRQIVGQLHFFVLETALQLRPHSSTCTPRPYPKRSCGNAWRDNV